MNGFVIEETELIFAENLNIDGNDPEAIVKDCISQHCVHCMANNRE